MNTIDLTNSQEIYTVSRLNREVRMILEGSFATIWLEGEISNFAAPNSGHWYFSLKDPLAQVRCAMFRLQNKKLNFTPKDGLHVLVKAQISLYEGRGEFQLLIDHMEDIGEGKLRQEFEALKKRLMAAGLFAETHKISLPKLPKKIGIITSPTGAAIRDILSVLKRRYCCAEVIIYPTLVQGESAAPNIVRAIQTANRRNECDVLILARGGGSLEDLWPFNEEQVAHAIHQSELPIISGVGHEIDVTIADFVADVRAPTPSAAAELIAPHAEEMQEYLQKDLRVLQQLFHRKLQHAQQELLWSVKHLQQQHPKRRLREQTQQLDLAEIKLVQLQIKLITHHQHQLRTLRAHLFQFTPTHKIKTLHQRLQHDLRIAVTSIKQCLLRQHQHLNQLTTQLDTLSPLATLKRGYAIATHHQKVLFDSDQVQMGDAIEVQLMSGKLKCRVE